MWKSFNSKIFALALLPFYAYIVISVFVLVQSGYRFEVFHPLSVILITSGTFLAAVCFSFSKIFMHWLGLTIILLLGLVGVYIGLTSKPFNWPELIVSSLLIAFGVAMKDFVGNRLHEK